MFFVLKPAGHLVLIVGNNNLCGRSFPTETYLRQIAEDVGFHVRLRLVAPARRMPMQVLGGKGSGKTHLLRRLALASKTRWLESLGEPDKQLPFLAVYVRCDGLNAYRFSGKSHDAEAWRAIFQFFGFVADTCSFESGGCRG
jgi:hypothetical protein